MRILFLIIVLCFSSVTFSQNELFTLQKAVATGILQNPEIHQMDARIEAAKNRWRLVSGIESPEFSFFREGIGQTEKFAEQRLAISQSFEFPLTIAYRHRALKQEYQALIYEKEFLEKNIGANVKKAYIELLFTIYRLALMNEQLQLAEEIFNVTSQRSEAGLGSDLDLLKSQIGIAEAENDQENATLKLDIARNQLFATVGLDASETAQILAFQDTLRVDEEKLQFSDTENIMLHHPLYKATQARIDAASESLKEARSILLPDLSASYYQQDYGNGYDFHGFEIGLKIPLWLPLERKGMVIAAKTGISELEWQLQRLEIEIRKDAENAVAGYQTSRSAIQRYNETISARAQLFQELSLEAFRLGSVDLLHALDARQTWLQSRMKYLDELKNYYIQLTEIEIFWHETIIY